MMPTGTTSNWGGHRPNSGRSKTVEDPVTLTATIERDHLEEIDRRAQKEGVTRPAWVRQMIEERLSEDSRERSLDR